MSFDVIRTCDDLQVASLLSHRCLDFSLANHKSRKVQVFDSYDVSMSSYFPAKPLL